MKWWQPKGTQGPNQSSKHRPHGHAHAAQESAQSQAKASQSQGAPSEVNERIEKLDRRTDALLRDAGSIRRESEMTTEAIRRDMKARQGGGGGSK